MSSSLDSAVSQNGDDEHPVSLMWPLWLLVCCVTVHAWSQEEMDVYDLVEEVGQKGTFYQLLEVSQNATSAEVRRSFRQLSLLHHPDKNREEGAEARYRQMVGVYEVLRNNRLREIYDNFLVNGLPDWRSAMFYYRRMRKMGLLEIAAILSVIITVGQYITAWAGYHDKRMIVEEQLRPKAKREKLSVSQLDALISQAMLQFRPSWYNTLPFQTVRAVVWLFTGAPGDLSATCRRMLRERRDQRAADQLAAAQKRLQARKQEEQQERRKQQKERRRRHRVEEHEQRQGEEGDSGLLQGSGVQAVQFEDWSLARSGVWTDEDLSALSKLVSKYPPGVADRWPTIARALERTIAEVVQMTQMIRERPQLVPAATTSPADQSADGGRVKTRATSLTDADTSTPWTQLQQKALEKALVQFPKGSAERWERVAKLVPGKSKEECILRFRMLAEKLRKKRQEEAESVNGGEVDLPSFPAGVPAETLET